MDKIETLMNFISIKNNWIISEQDIEVDIKRKKAFLAFSKFFLKEKAIKYILFGKMEHKNLYIESLK